MPTNPNNNPSKPRFKSQGEVTKVAIPEDLYVYLHEQAGIDTSQSHIGGSNYTRRLLDKLELNENSNVLDIGCGRGGELTEIAEETGAYVYGIDNNKAIYKKAKEHAEQSENVEVKFGKVEDNTSYPDDTQFDAGICLGVLPFIRDKKAVWKNAHNVIKQDGVFVFTEFPPTVPKEEVEDLYWPQELTPPPATKEMESVLKEIGFEDTTVIDRTKELKEQTIEVKDSYPRKEVRELFSEEYEKTARDLLSNWIDALDKQKIEFASIWCQK